MIQQTHDSLNDLIGHCRARVKQYLRAATVLVMVSATMSLPVMSRQVGPKAPPPVAPPSRKNTDTGKAMKKPAKSRPAPKTQERQIDWQAPALVELKNSFVKLPAGEFMMGSENGDADEKPVHRVRISQSFEMGKYEVTEAQWAAIMARNLRGFDGANLPVEKVSWDEVKGFIDKLNERNDSYLYRLPTEAEWEYACRAGTTTEFAFGDSLSTKQANFLGSYEVEGTEGEEKRYYVRSMAVGSYQPNAWGLYDMHGNIWEWCQDWYSKNYYAQSPNVDPIGPSTGPRRVLRGGFYLVPPQLLRSAVRVSADPALRVRGCGFRLVRTPR